MSKWKNLSRPIMLMELKSVVKNFPTKGITIMAQWLMNSTRKDKKERKSRLATGWDKISAKHLPVKELVSTLHEELL